MEENKKPKEQNNNNNQRELDKNKTLEKPGADVVDYGRSEQMQLRKARQARNVIRKMTAKENSTGSNRVGKAKLVYPAVVEQLLHRSV